MAINVNLACYFIFQLIIHLYTKASSKENHSHNIKGLGEFTINDTKKI